MRLKALEGPDATTTRHPTADGFCGHIVFELCAEDLDACRAASQGGAHRIELCSELDVGGLTPPDALIAAAVEQSSLPVHVLVRPTAETFEYSPAMFQTTLDSLKRMKRLGVAGFVLGMLHGGRVDRAHTRALVEAAEGLPVTFHRAFDEIEDRQQGLEDVIASGCARVLTSAGAWDVLAGAAGLALLARQAAGRIAVAAGGGLRLGNAAAVARISGLRHFHGSLRDPEITPGELSLSMEKRIATLVAILQQATCAPASLAP